MRQYPQQQSIFACNKSLSTKKNTLKDAKQFLSNSFSYFTYKLHNSNTLVVLLRSKMCNGNELHILCTKVFFTFGIIAQQWSNTNRLPRKRGNIHDLSSLGIKIKTSWLKSGIFMSNFRLNLKRLSQFLKYIFIHFFNEATSCHIYSAKSYTINKKNIRLDCSVQIYQSRKLYLQQWFDYIQKKIKMTDTVRYISQCRPR